MKTTIDKCEQCGRLFEDEAKYEAHVQAHRNLLVLEGAFPKVKDEGCKFANGGWSVQRSQEWLYRYKAAILELVPACDYAPFTYGWWRTLDDGGSMYYGVALRIEQVCPKCFREWGQPFYAINCSHTDKVKEDRSETS